MINIFNCYSVILIKNDMKYHRTLLSSDVSYLMVLDKPYDHFIEKYDFF